MTRFAAFVGWDWADKEHELRVREAGSDEIEKLKVTSTPEGLHGWAAKIRERFGGRPIAICIETSRGAVIWSLMAYEHIVLYPVNPKSAANFRETFHPSGKKDDPVDADELLELLYKHHEKLRPLTPADPATRSLGILSEHRRKLAHGLVRETNRLRTNLKSYFPQALELTNDLGTMMACDFLDRWSSLSSVQHAREASLRDFYRKHGSRSESRIEERVQLVRRAVPLTTDEAIVSCGMLVTRAQVCVIRALLQAIADLEERLSDLYTNHVEHDLIDSFPGLGVVLGSRVIAMLGSDRERYESREALQQITGVAPITKRTGGKNGPVLVQRRLRRSKFLHQTVVEWAAQTIALSPWSRAFYDQQRDAGKNHWSAVRALAYKWLRILFRCWQEREQYSEQTYFQALCTSGSPLVAKINTA